MWQVEPRWNRKPLPDDEGKKNHRILLICKCGCGRNCQAMMESFSDQLVMEKMIDVTHEDLLKRLASRCRFANADKKLMKFVVG